MPCLVMPTGTTSYFSGSMARSTLRAEARETSCSLDWPPNRTPTRIFLGKRSAPLVIVFEPDDVGQVGGGYFEEHGVLQGLEAVDGVGWDMDKVAGLPGVGL